MMAWSRMSKKFILREVQIKHKVKVNWLMQVSQSNEFFTYIIELLY